MLHRTEGYFEELGDGSLRVPLGVQQDDLTTGVRCDFFSSLPPSPGWRAAAG
jgi:hypothetical protein